MIKKAMILSVGLNVILLGIFVYLIHALGGFQYVLFKAKNRGATGVYQHRMNLFKQLPIQRGDIVFLGNSITEQCEWAELLGNSKIRNRGISGDGTEGVLRRLGEICKGQPAQIFLCIGINDLISHSPDWVISNYRKIVKEISQNAPHSELILQSILPVNNQIRNLNLRNEDIKTINDEIRTMAKNQNLTFVDLNTVFSDQSGRLKPEFTNDGIHINGRAYLLWKNTIQHLIKK